MSSKEGVITLPFDIWTNIFKLFLAQPKYDPSRLGIIRAINRKTRQWVNSNRASWVFWTTMFVPDRMQMLARNDMNLSEEQARVVFQVAQCMADPKPQIIQIQMNVRSGRTTLMQMWTDFLLAYSDLKIAIVCADWNETREITSGLLTEPSTHKRMVEARCLQLNGQSFASLDFKEDLNEPDVLLVDNYQNIEPDSLYITCKSMLRAGKRGILMGNIRNCNTLKNYSGDRVNGPLIRVERVQWMEGNDDNKKRKLFPYFIL